MCVCGGAECGQCEIIISIFYLCRDNLDDFDNVSIDIGNSKGDDEDNISNFTHHWSVHVPECSFLTVKDFSLNFVSFLVHSERKKKCVQNCFHGACSSFQNTYDPFTPSHV